MMTAFFRDATKHSSTLNPHGIQGERDGLQSHPTSSRPAETSGTVTNCTAKTAGMCGMCGKTLLGAVKIGGLYSTVQSAHSSQKNQQH